MMLINSGLFFTSSDCIAHKDLNSSQLTMKYYPSKLNNTENPKDLTRDSCRTVRFSVCNISQAQVINYDCFTWINRITAPCQYIPSNNIILRQLDELCSNRTFCQMTYQLNDTAVQQLEVLCIGKLMPPNDKTSQNSSICDVILMIPIFSRDMPDLISDYLNEALNSVIKQKCSNTSDAFYYCHHNNHSYWRQQKCRLSKLQCKNNESAVYFSCSHMSYNCDKLNLSSISQRVNSTITLEGVNKKKYSIHLPDFGNAIQPPNYVTSSIQKGENSILKQELLLNATGPIYLCTLLNDLFREYEHLNGSSNIHQEVSSVQPVKKELRIEPVNRVRHKRNSEMQTTGLYSSMSSQLLPPRNLQIVPLSFGSFNISWIPARRNERFITHYELILFNLNELSERPIDHCPRIKTIYNHTDHFVYQAPSAQHSRQLVINITAPSDYAVITRLPPDTFYRVLLFAVSNALKSPPATMPSSPRVPALSPRSPPENVKVTSRGTQSAKISWSPPNDIDCTGELIDYVININSSRLIEPMVIKVPRSRRSHVVENLIPGTFYTVQVSATNRGGLGVPSKMIHFQTSGELPKIDPDELETIEMTDSTLEFNMEKQNADFFEDENKADDWIDSSQQHQQGGNSPLYVIPSRIHNLRATVTQTSIKLKWSVALRQINMESETHLFDNIDYEYTSLINPRHLIPVSMKSEGHSTDKTGLLPPGTKYVIRWGDMHPGPSEDTVQGDQTQYTIENLRPGTVYYIRVISVTEGGNGPAAYTVVMTQDSSTTTKTINHGLLIPVNLVVRQLGSTWARIGWEMPNIPQSVKMSISGFQVKYYQVKSSSQDEYKNELEDSISIGEKSSTEQSVDKSHEMKFINMTVSPNQFQAENFDLTLRNLKPATQYEFGVRMLNNEMTIDRQDIDNHQRTAKNYFWSMVQGFETFGRSPKDAPSNIRLTKLKLNNRLHTKLQLLDFSSASTSTTSTTVSSEPEDSSTSVHANRNHEKDSPSSRLAVTMLIKWDPPSYPNGRILGSVLYLTTNSKQSKGKWIERSVNGKSTEAGLLRMQPNTLYFVRIIARNQNGRSPYSSIIAFYTPNADGTGGGIIKFSKNYYNLHDIDEPLDRLIPFPNEEELNSLLKLQSNTDTSNNNNNKLIETENIHWIILGGVLGGALVIMIVITMVLLSRCRRAKTSTTSLTKRLSNRSPYNLSTYSNCRQHEATVHGHECLQKNASFHVNDTCLNANVLGSCSPAETLAGGSNPGSLGVCTGHSITNEQINQGIRMNYYPTQNSTCLHSDCNTKKITETVPLLTTNQCNCVTSSDATTPMNWLSNNGAFNIGMPAGGGYFEDRHSTSAESEPDGNSSIKMTNCHEDGRKWRNNAGCNKFGLNKQWPNDSTESANIKTSSPHEMTLSYLATGVQNPVNCHTHCCQQQQQQQLKNMVNPGGYKTATAIPMLPPVANLQMSCCNNANSLQTNFNRSRDFRSNQMNKMTGEHGLTGSGSLTDEVTASSPGSSATGRTHGYLSQISPSPTNTSLKFKKYNRIIGKYDDDYDTNDKLILMTGNMNCKRDANFRISDNKFDGLGTRQKLSVNPPNDQPNISPIPLRKYHGSKGQILCDNQSERCQNLGTGITSRNNALSSDYASQQSSLSNKSSGSSAANHGFSPEKNASYPNKVPVIDMNNTNNQDIGASFVLDRVPTPEPQHRTGPFARLMQYNLSDQQVSRLQIHDMDDYQPNNMGNKSSTVQSPGVMKRKTLNISGSIPATAAQNAFSPELEDTSEFTKREITPDTPDSISEQEMMRGFSTEELNQEMANLEGLMKNLSEITQKEFTC